MPKRLRLDRCRCTRESQCDFCTATDEDFERYERQEESRADSIVSNEQTDWSDCDD